MPSQSTIRGYNARLAQLCRWWATRHHPLYLRVTRLQDPDDENGERVIMYGHLLASMVIMFCIDHRPRGRMMCPASVQGYVAAIRWGSRQAHEPLHPNFDDEIHASIKMYKRRFHVERQRDWHNSQVGEIRVSLLQYGTAGVTIAI